MPVLTSSRRERFVQGIIAGATATAAYTAAGYTGKGAAQSAQRLLKNSEIRARKAELKEKEMVLLSQVEPGKQPLVQFARERAYRIAALQDFIWRAQVVISARAEMYKDTAGGGSSGLLVETVRSVRNGKKFRLIREMQFDRALAAELREHLKQAAIEAGEWQQEGRVLPPATVDVSDLTDEQLFEEQRILREAREKLDANRAGKPQPQQIEAPAGSVEQVDESSFQNVSHADLVDGYRLGGDTT
jgi:hypothetical protein